MKVSLRKYAKALCESLKNEKDAKIVVERIQSLLKLLTRRKQSKLIKQLPEVFKTVWFKKHNKMAVNVVLASEPSEEEIKEIVNLLTNAFKKEVIISTRINSRIIGGMKLEFDDYVIDGTVAANLLKLKQNLTSV